MISFVESGMTFSFPDSDVFQIEKSATYFALQNGTKVCECIVSDSSKAQILLIEAKSSFSNPQNNIEQFSNNVCDITEKFINSLLLYYGFLLNRPYKILSTLPENLKLENFLKKQNKIIPVLVINNFEKTWLPPVKEALNNRIKKFSFSKILLLEDMQVLTKEMAIKLRIVQS